MPGDKKLLVTNTSARQTWALMKPYWFSDQRWRARLLLAAIIALSLGQVGISVLINQWNAVFYNALQDKKYDIFIHQLGVFALLAGVYIIIAVYRQYLNQMLHISWRQWMTNFYQHLWLSDRSYYRLQAIYKSTDNPDQRIADDIDIFTSSTLSLGIGLLSSVVTLVSFVTILWGLSGALAFTLLGHAITIPGYMVWAALVYAIFGTAMTHAIGRSLIALQVNKQRYEANYRFSLIRVREQAEAIAFYRGEAVEAATLTQKFGDIVSNWWQIMRKQKQLTWFTSAYGQAAVIFPFVVAAPRYFAGAIQLGGLMQISSAFGQVQGALSWFIDVYPQFATWKAATNRLHGFTSAMIRSTADTATSGITRNTAQTTSVSLDALALNLPDGSPLVQALSCTIEPNTRLLITGPSGCGKTTLMRAIAGLWPYGQGTITQPTNASILFIPQKPYLPPMSLRDVICYPHASAHYTDAAIAQALTLAGLSMRTQQLDETATWSASLSLGEQQRLAFARLFLQRPHCVLLDEATASLDETAEAQLYETLLHELPDCMLISIGHRSTLQRWHSTTLSLAPNT